MKTYRARYLTAFCIFACFCSVGCDPKKDAPKDSKKEHPTETLKGGGSTPDNEKLKAEIVNLETEIGKLKTESGKLRKENEDLNNKIQELQANIVPLKLKMFLLGAGALIGAILIGGTFLVIRQKPAPPHQSPETGAALRNCPRCGWRITEGESACSNPECRTRI